MNPAEFVNIAEAERHFWWYRGMRGILFSLLDPWVENRKIGAVLEAGCGTGYNAAALERRYGWRMYALDLEREGLAYGSSLGAARLIQGDVAALPFPAEAFDAVVCLDVIVHFPRGDEYRAVGEFSRVLKPGGLLALRVSALDSLRSRHSEFTHERQRFTARRLVAAVRSHGIRVLCCTYANSLLLPAAFLKFRVAEPLLRAPPASGVGATKGWFNEMLAAPLELESRLLRAGVRFPLGQSLILIGERQV